MLVDASATSIHVQFINRAGAVIDDYTYPDIAPPVAVDDTVVTAVDTLAIIDVAGNDSDPKIPCTEITGYGLDILHCWSP